MKINIIAQGPKGQVEFAQVLDQEEAAEMVESFEKRGWRPVALLVDSDGAVEQVAFCTKVGELDWNEMPDDDDLGDQRSLRNM